MGIKILLNTASIALQDKRENIYNKPSGQEANIILLLNKGKRPQA